MRAIIWTRSNPTVVAKLSAGLEALCYDIDKAEGIEGTLAGLDGADLLILSDPGPADARALVRKLAAPDRTLRHIHFVSAGHESMEAAGIPEGIGISGPDGALSSVVAEHALALTLALYRQIPAACAEQSRARWGRNMVRKVRSLEDATVLVVGLGHVGRAVARRMRPFGGRIVAVNRSQVSCRDIDEAHPFEALDGLLAQADVVVLAVAMGPQTLHLLDQRRLRLCKPDTVIVNIGRGGLIDTEALREALVNGTVGGAGLDVTDPEPLPPDHPLWHAPNLIVTAHYAGGGGRRAGQRIADGAIAAAKKLAARMAC